MPQRKKRRVMPSVGFFSCTVIFVMLILRSFKLKGRKSVVGLSDDGQDDGFAFLAVVNALLACDCLRHKLLEVEISSYWYLQWKFKKYTINKFIPIGILPKKTALPSSLTNLQIWRR